MIKRTLLILTAIAGLTIASYGQNFKLSSNATYKEWRAGNGAPLKTEKQDDGSVHAYWHFSRFEVEATFVSNGALSCFNIEALPGRQVLKMSEAAMIANTLGLPPYHMEDGTPFWGNTNDDVAAYFEDGTFHFEASHDNDPDSPDSLSKDQREEIIQQMQQGKN